LRGACDLRDRLRIPPVHGPERSAFERSAAFAFVDVDHDRALAAERLEDRQAHQSEAACADDHDRLRRINIGELPQCAVGRHA
jgi:hypothetical protein